MARAVWSGVISFGSVSQRSGEEVDQADIVRGVEVGDDEFVMVTDEELEAIAPRRSRALEISAFVDLAPAGKTPRKAS